MSFIYNMADTWNAAGTTFNAILMNISNGAGGAPVGAAASKSFNLQANGTTIFNVDISGNTAIGGVATALGTIHSQVSGAANNVFTDAYGGAPSFIFRRANGVVGGATNAAANDILGGVGARGYGTTGFSAASKVSVNLIAAEAWSDTAQGTRIEFATTLNTTVTRSVMMVLQNSGGLCIGATAVLTDPGANNLLIQGQYQSSVAPTAISGGSVLLGSAATINNRLSVSLNGTTYWIPCSSTAF